MPADSVIEPYFRLYKGEETNPYDEITNMDFKRFWNLEKQWALFKDNEKYIAEALDLYSKEGLDDFCEDDGVPIEFKAYLMCRMVKSPHYIYQTKDFKKKYFEMCYFNRNRFRYYKGEDSNPFKKKDFRSNFWYGEREFINTHQSIKHWEAQGKRVIEELEQACNDELLSKVKAYSPETFGLMVYIKKHLGKWCPYDSLDWVLTY